MKIIVENCVFMNGGDSAIGFALKQIVEDALPEAEITFADSGLPAIARYYPEIDFTPLPSFVMEDAPLLQFLKKRLGAYRKYFVVRRVYLACAVAFTRLLRRIGLPVTGRVGQAIAPYLDADLVITTGGTYLLSKYDCTRRILEFQKDLQLGKPLIAFTQSFEPFADDYRARALARQLHRMRAILVRHETSRGHVEDLIGRSDHVVTAADCVFALWRPGPVTVAERRIRSGRDADDRLRIGVSVRQLKSFGVRDRELGISLYRQSILAAVTALVRDHGAEVTFLSTCQGIDEYWTDDSAVAAEFAAGLPADVAASVQVDRDFHTPLDLIERLKAFDGVIPCRLHMAILSVCANTPALPVSYEPKFQETFAELGLPDLVTDVAEIEPEAFAQAVRAWAADLDGVNAAIARGAPAMKASAQSAGTVVAQAYAAWQRDRRAEGPPAAKSARRPAPRRQTDTGD
ncbi:MAG: polysaccharide pyruvyl transferase family protein [Pseudomonadota bacterium]